MKYEAILYEKKDGVAVITINQPQMMNALVQPVFDELSAVTKEISKDEEVKVVVLTGAGKAFCAGGDLNRFLEGYTQTSAMDYVEDIHPFCKDWTNLKQPTIAAVNGAATGAGMSLALMCDMSIASDKVKIGCSFINMGLIPDMAGAYYLPRIVGVQKAKELMFTGRLVEAEEALQIGLVNQVVAHDQLMDEVMALATKLAKAPSFALRNTKRMVNMSLDMDLNNLLTLEAAMQSICFLTEDSKEAVTAFLEKRKPEFKGR